jgi:hypothetical protein
MDRHIGRDRVSVQFLGRRTWFLRTPALMAFMTGAPLLPCFLERVGPGRFKACAGVPIESGAIVRATKPSRPRRRSSRINRARACASIPNTGITSIATGMRRQTRPISRFERRMDPLTHIVVGRAVVAAFDGDGPGARRRSAAILGAPHPTSTLVWPLWLGPLPRVHEVGTHSLARPLATAGPAVGRAVRDATRRS